MPTVAVVGDDDRLNAVAAGSHGRRRLRRAVGREEAGRGRSPPAPVGPLRVIPSRCEARAACLTNSIAIRTSTSDVELSDTQSFSSKKALTRHAARLVRQYRLYYWRGTTRRRIASGRVVCGSQFFSGAHSWVCPKHTGTSLSLSMPFDCIPVARHFALLGRRPVPVWGWLCLCGGTEGLPSGLGRRRRVWQICHTPVPAVGLSRPPFLCLGINLQGLGLPSPAVVLMDGRCRLGWCRELADHALARHGQGFAAAIALPRDTDQGKAVIYRQCAHRPAPAGSSGPQNSRSEPWSSRITARRTNAATLLHSRLAAWLTRSTSCAGARRVRRSSLLMMLLLRRNGGVLGAQRFAGRP